MKIAVYVLKYSIIIFIKMVEIGLQIVTSMKFDYPVPERGPFLEPATVWELKG